MALKKIAVSTMTTILLATTVFAENISLNINNQPVQTDTAPQIVNGRTLVPLRVISEAMGANVEWDGDTKTVSVEQFGISLSLNIGSTSMTKNGESITLDTPAQIINGRTMVPIRAISESLGCMVNWDADTKSVNISTEISDRDLSLYAGLAERNALSFTDEPVIPQYPTDPSSSSASSSNTDMWISGLSNFSLVEISEKGNPGVNYIEKSAIPGYVKVYAFTEFGLTGDHIVYIVDEMTDAFMTAQNAEGTFNGIRMKKQNGNLFFNAEDLNKLDIPVK